MQILLTYNNKFPRPPKSGLPSTMIDQTGKKDQVYPVLDMYATSRVSDNRVNNSKIPIMKYNRKVSILNTKSTDDTDKINPSYLSKFQEGDGLIYGFKQIINKESYINRQTIQTSGQPKKGLKILVCVCMYNQSKNAINLTLNGIYKNLKSLSEQNISPGDIAVVLIQDGILKLVSDKVKRKYAKGSQSMVQFYKRLDRQQGKKKCILQQRINLILDETQNYQRKDLKKKVSNNRDIPPSIQKSIALVYQNLWWPQKTDFSKQKKQLNQSSSEEDNKWRLKIFSCFKHTNGTKLSSHLWFFEGFCRYLNPQFCVLLDVGTTPDQTGLLNLIRGFDQGPNVGGVSGFMSVDPNFPSEQGGAENDDDQNCITKHIFSIQKAQQYEYIMSHFLDKNQQSILGFLHVLPGAWSAYRYDALIKSDKYEPNLLQRSYFKMILNPNLQQKDYTQANMYLAEDRILSLGIYCQMDSKYILRYVPNARADTDPMKDHQNLMNQRRRWINSSLFAFMYAYKNYFYNVMDSRHNFCRRYITLNISMLIALLSSFNAYITPSIYFFVLYSTIYQLGFPGSEWVAKSVCLLYVFVVFIAVGGALTGRSWSKKAHIVSALLAVFTFALTILVFFNLFLVYLKVAKNPFISDSKAGFDLSGQNRVLFTVIVMLAINIFCSVFIVLMHLPTHFHSVLRLIIDAPSYIAYTGAYSQTMVIHAFCNVDDVSWGTKGSAGSGQNKFQADKVYFVSTWGLVNGVLAFIFMYVDIISRENSVHERGDIILLAIAIYGTGFLFIKTILAIMHHFKWMLCIKCCHKQYDPERYDIVNQYWKKRDAAWAEYQSLINSPNKLKELIKSKKDEKQKVNKAKFKKRS